MTKRVTIKDIAKCSGYSVNCVSRALMDAKDISDGTKKKIRSIAESLGYVRNGNAEALRRGSSRTMAVLFDSLLNPFYFIMTNYLWEKLSARGYSILTFKSDSFVFNENMARRIATANVDGLISFLKPSAEAQALLDSSKIPSVVIGRKTFGLCSSVILDDYLGGQLAAQNFLQRGFSQPVYLGESQALDCSRERATGFADAFAEKGVRANIKYLEQPLLRKFARTFNEMCANGESFDCIFCFCDMAAYEVMFAMNDESAPKVPVIGFDNIQREILMPGTLTTVSYDKQAMVEKALELLFRHIDGDAEISEIVIRDLSVSSVEA